MKLVPQRLNLLHRCLHYDKLTPKSASFDCDLTLTIPYNQCTIHKQQQTGLGPPGYCVPRMVQVNKAMR